MGGGVGRLTARRVGRGFPRHQGRERSGGVENGETGGSGPWLASESECVVRVRGGLYPGQPGVLERPLTVWNVSGLAKGMHRLADDIDRGLRPFFQTQLPICISHDQAHAGGDGLRVHTCTASVMLIPPLTLGEPGEHILFKLFECHSTSTCTLVTSSCNSS